MTRCNNPLTSYLEDKAMTGALIGMDDVWQTSSLPYSVQHYGQVIMMHNCTIMLMNLVKLVV